MNSEIVLSAEQILRSDTVESSRLELKARWDEVATGPQVIKTIAAFANDFQNQNGGYVVIGVAEEAGKAVLPPVGLSASEIDAAQKWIRGHCMQLEPVYNPYFEVGTIDGKRVLVIWIPGSDMRPHLAPDGIRGSKDLKYFIRIGSETIVAKGGNLTALVQMTARTPFDNRRNALASVSDIRETKVREFLHDIESGLERENDTKALYRKLNITAPVNNHDDPRNVGLLFFSEDPERWFPGARIEVVQFANGASGDVIEEKKFCGGIHEQLRGALRYLETISSTTIEKSESSFRVRNIVSYPILALREALVNAVYHRSYEGVMEPVKVYLFPDKIQIISYPGPMAGIRRESLRPPFDVPPVPARNSRIGEFLKDLHLAEGRSTGLPKIASSMRENGSGVPVFDFDDAHTYFRVTLPAHPEYVAVSTVRDVAHLKTIGHDEEAIVRLREAWGGLRKSPTLTEALLRELVARGNISEADLVLESFRQEANPRHAPRVVNAYIDALLDVGLDEKAKGLLDSRKQMVVGADALDMAILARRARDDKQAHILFERCGSLLENDPRALHEFAQTKIGLARAAYKMRRFRENRRLLVEALHLLERVVHMNADSVRRAWAYRDIGRVQFWLGYPLADREESLRRACELLPEEAERFRAEVASKKGTA